MCQCWNNKSKERPTFSSILNRFIALSSSDEIKDFKITEDRPYFTLEPPNYQYINKKYIISLIK